MPLEGHWERQQTPLRLPSAGGGRLLVGAAAVLLVAGAVLLVVVLAGGGSARPAPGCINFTGPSTTGAATIHACGRTAERTCRLAERQNNPLARAVRAECRRMRERQRGGR